MSAVTSAPERRVALAGGSSEPLVLLRGAGVRFGRSVALEGVDFELRSRERVVLIGGNGSGKTTLLRLLHGMLAPSQGQRHASAHPMRQAMVFQRPFLLRLSVRNNLRVALWLAGVPARERDARADDALARVGLSGQGARPARVLSGGQQQRLALARAWAVRPQLLFLDEPTASLDPHAKSEVERLIGEFADEGMTLVMSTHNLGQAKRLATRVLYLEQARVVCDLPTERFFNHSLPPAAAAFVKGELPWLT